GPGQACRCQGRQVVVLSDAHASSQGVTRRRVRWKSSSMPSPPRAVLFLGFDGHESGEGLVVLGVLEVPRPAVVVKELAAGVSCGPDVRPCWQKHDRPFGQCFGLLGGLDQYGLVDDAHRAPFFTSMELGMKLAARVRGRLRGLLV